MKRILSVITLLVLLVSSVFAVDWVKYNTYETEEMETIDVYFDYDETEPLDIKNESIRYFLYLQDTYEDVDVWLENMEDWWLYSEAVEYNCYAIRIEHRDYCIIIYIHDDNTVTVYSCRVPKNQTEE